MLFMVHREALLSILPFVFSFRNRRGSEVMRILTISVWFPLLSRRVADSHIIHFFLKLFHSLNAIVYISPVLLYYLFMILSNIWKFIGSLLDFSHLLKEFYLMPWHFRHLFVHIFNNLLIDQALREQLINSLSYLDNIRIVLVLHWVQPFGE